jgi:acyl carrier protein
MNPVTKNRFNFILKRHFLIQPSRLKRRKYLEDLGINTVEKKELLNYFEEEFKIQFSELDERKIRTIDDTINILDKYLNYAS